MNSHKKGFTLLEVVIIAVVVSLGIATVIFGLSNANKYLQVSREKIIAINLAREGMEQMINIRDTNWKKNMGQLEGNWLRTNPMDDTQTSRFSSGVYILQKQLSGGQEYFVGSGLSIDYNSNSGFNTNNLQYSLCQNTGGRYPCPGTKPNSVEGSFFRKVNGIGLYQKNNNTVGGILLNCPTSGANTTCSDTSAKEYRFCVVVNYISQNTGKVELCGVLTNFKK